MKATWNREILKNKSKDRDSMEAYWCHAVQKQSAQTNASRRLTTAPEDLEVFWKTYNCYGRLISTREHLLTAQEHLLTALEHFHNCSGTLS